MKRRGQIFLIMTILTVSFMIGITSVLLDVQKADYIDPAPDNEVTLRAWEITVESLERVLDTQLSISTQTGNTAQINLDTQIGKVEDYIRNRGLAVLIQNTSEYTVTIAGDGTSIVNNTIVASFQISIASSSTTIQQSITIQISYVADASSVTNRLIVTKSINNKIEYITGCTPTTIIDLGDGTYDISAVTGITDVVTPSNVLFQVSL